MLTSSHRELFFLLILQQRGNRPEPPDEHWLGKTLKTNIKIHEIAAKKSNGLNLSLALVVRCEKKFFRPRTGRERTNLLSNQYKSLLSYLLVSAHKSKLLIFSTALRPKH